MKLVYLTKLTTFFASHDQQLDVATGGPMKKTGSSCRMMADMFLMTYRVNKLIHM